MKTVAKVFIIIGMVLSFWAILPLIFGFLALGKLNNATQKSDVAPLWAILTIIFVSPLAGILMFFIPDEEFAPAIEA